MFLVNYLITEAGFDDYANADQDPDALDSGDGAQGPPKVEYSDIKKFILYEQLKQINQLLNSMQFDRTDDEFHAIFKFCQNIIEFYNSFEYPEVVRLFDNLIDGLEEKLGLKLDKRIPFEFPIDPNPKPDVGVQPQQLPPNQLNQPSQSPQPTLGNTPIQNQMQSTGKQG